MKKNNEYMKKAKIKGLEDKDLQLRYFLGGLKVIYQCTYWACNINCSCDPVLDDENFKKNHLFNNSACIINDSSCRFFHSKC